MQGSELHPKPGNRHAAGRAVELVVIGHVGLSTVRTAEGEQTSPGGSGYAVAASAAGLIGGLVGLVAQVGQDFELSPLRRLGANLNGVARLPGASARLRIDQFADGTRSFSSDLGVAAIVRLDSFPPAYLGAARIHLGTAPPEQQLTWLTYLRGEGCRALISADMFEHYVTNSPDASREVCRRADLIFMNEAEYAGLYGLSRQQVLKAPLVLKRGPAGASFVVNGLGEDVRAPEADVVDPTGGGEILAGVFLALCTAGLPEVPALKTAVQLAAICVKEFGVLGPQLIAALEDLRSELHMDQPAMGIAAGRYSRGQ
jgi:sugar/nucleoside kinase (ribokinase family)